MHMNLSSIHTILAVVHVKYVNHLWMSQVRVPANPLGFFVLGWESFVSRGRKTSERNGSNRERLTE